MPVDLHTYETEAGWLQARRRFVCSSEASAVLGLSPYTNAFQLWREKTGAEPVDMKVSRRRLEVGHVMEPVMGRWAEEELDAYVARPSEAPFYLATNSDLPWAAATPDLVVVDPRPHLDGVIECKSAQIMQAAGYEQGEAFRHAAIQCQHTMAVIDKPNGWVAVEFGGGLDFRLYPVTPDPTLLQLLTIMGQEFVACVHEERPPGPEFITAGAEVRAAIAKIYDKESGEEIELHEPIWKERAERLLELGRIQAEHKSAQDAAEKEADAIKAEFMLAMGEATYAKIPGLDKVAKFHTQRGGAESVDTRWERRVFRLVNDPAKGRKKK